jgi:hypothetical protein
MKDNRQANIALCQQQPRQRRNRITPHSTTLVERLRAKPHKEQPAQIYCNERTRFSPPQRCRLQTNVDSTATQNSFSFPFYWGITQPALHMKRQPVGSLPSLPNPISMYDFTLKNPILSRGKYIFEITMRPIGLNRNIWFKNAVSTLCGAAF